VLMAISEHTGREYVTVETFNDKKKTTFADIQVVLRRTREIIVEGKPAPAPLSSFWEAFAIFRKSQPHGY
jgi:hypothetical protein